MSTQTTSYRDVKAVSNSILTEFEKDLRSFRAYWLYDMPFFNIDDPSLQLGSIIDTMLTRNEEFFNMFYVSVGKSPQPQIMKFCQNLFKIWPVKVEKDQVDSLFKQAYDETGFGRDSFDKVKEKFASEGGKEFFNELIKGKGKTVISNEVYQKALKIVESAKQNDFIKDILNMKSVEVVPGIETVTVVNQLEIYSEYTSSEGGCNIPIKGALDKIIIDHNLKLVYPYDIKSSSNLNTFETSYSKYRYFRQAGFYTWLLQKWLKERDLEGYTIMPFQFVVISTIGEGAYIYKISREDLVKSVEGGMTVFGVEYKGWKSLLDDICWHVKNNKWDYPRRVYEGNGVVSLNIFI